MAYDLNLKIGSFEAAADLSAKQFRVVKMATGGKVDVFSGATDVPIGILQNKPTAGQTAEVALTGSISKADSDAALAVGDIVSGQTDGQLEVADAGDYIVGVVVLASGAAGELASVLVTCPGIAKA